MSYLIPSLISLLHVTNRRQSYDQRDPSMKYSTVTAFDNNRAPFGVTDLRSKINQSDNKETWFFRESTGHVDVFLNHYQEPFADKIGGQVAFPWGKGYSSGASKHIELF